MVFVPPPPYPVIAPSVFPRPCSPRLPADDRYYAGNPPVLASEQVAAYHLPATQPAWTQAEPLIYHPAGDYAAGAPLLSRIPGQIAPYQLRSFPASWPIHSQHLPQSEPPQIQHPAFRYTANTPLTTPMLVLEQNAPYYPVTAAYPRADLCDFPACAPRHSQRLTQNEPLRMEAQRSPPVRSLTPGHGPTSWSQQASSRGAPELQWAPKLSWMQRQTARGGLLDMNPFTDAAWVRSRYLMAWFDCCLTRASPSDSTLVDMNSFTDKRHVARQMAKHCKRCGRGTMKPGRAVCKDCGSSEFEGKTRLLGIFF